MLQVRLRRIMPAAFAVAVVLLPKEPAGSAGRNTASDGRSSAGTGPAAYRPRSPPAYGTPSPPRPPQHVDSGQDQEQGQRSSQTSAVARSGAAMASTSSFIPYWTSTAQAAAPMITLNSSPRSCHRRARVLPASESSAAYSGRGRLVVGRFGMRRSSEGCRKQLSGRDPDPTAQPVSDNRRCRLPISLTVGPPAQRRQCTQ